MGKRALVTGITGQDASYMAEFLLAKGYTVYGLKRRTSNLNTQRIGHLLDKITLLDGDLLDSFSMAHAVKTAQPDEVYNLAAQSFVQTSFKQPEYTGESTGLGVTRLLEAVREHAPKARFYQASSSEMFGMSPPPQNEDSAFHPRSPYGCAKMYAYWIVINYREAYDMYACNGMGFNHECVTAETPVIIRQDGMINILPIEEVVPHRESPHAGLKQTSIPAKTLEVWDRNGWTKVTCMTATWNKGDKKVHTIAARGAVFSATSDHVAFLRGKTERPVGKIKIGDNLDLGDNPLANETVEMTDTEAWFLGLLAGDGGVSPRGRVRVTNTNKALLEQATLAWRTITGHQSTPWQGKSGFCGTPVDAINCNGASVYGLMLRQELYTEKGDKKVPFRVLNGTHSVQMAFLKGYNAADGLRAGHCNYEFKSFKTASPCLAAGLYWLASNALKQRIILCTEKRNDATYYQINLNSPTNENHWGSHLIKDESEVVKTHSFAHKGWLFDLATESGTFHAGIGKGWIHNSPRRGIEFVTQKIAYGAAAIKKGLATELVLGNLDAKRDWGHARDFVEAMWMMLQADNPKDYVIATGEVHSVREFCELAFGTLGLDYIKYIRTNDAAFMRPSEVDYLCGDYSRIRNDLGWNPKTTFKDLVKEMVESAMADKGLEIK